MGIWQSGLDKRILHSRRCYTEDMLLDRDLRRNPEAAAGV